ncbi:MAG: HEAT repeat domain-containing protein [Planctomycetota bacterium]|nr:HEAT repeat domain-containing protein [Planctomycetota bacterium]
MTEIFFCDLCNESVPLSDLDGGRAFRIKGRVVCATCNLTMTQPAVAAAAPIAAAPVHSHGHAHAVASTRDAGGSYAALTLAAVALGGVAFVGYWVHGEVGKLHKGQSSELALAQDRLAELSRQLASERAAREELRVALVGKLDSELATLSSAQVQHAENAARAAEEVRLALNGVQGSVARVDDALMRLERQDGELLTLQKHVNELQLGAREAEARFDEELEALRQSQSAAPAAAPAEERPSWWPLVQQLKNESVSERYGALVALAATRDPQAAEHVLPLLADQDIFLRMAAARTLGDLGNPIAVEPLINTLEDAEGVVREAAYLSLRAITRRDLPFDAQSSDAAERTKRVKAWREWWEKEKPKFAGN